MSFVKLFPLMFIFSFTKVLDFSPSVLGNSNAGLQINYYPRSESIIFQSNDKGKTWKDISKGLPKKIENFDFYNYEKGLFFQTKNEIFQMKSNASTPNWTKEYTVDDVGKVNVCKSGLFAIKYYGKISKKHASKNTWVPIYSNSELYNIRTIFETKSGAILIGTDNGIFKSTNEGKTWKHVLNMGWVIKIVESNGVLIATNLNGIIRSTDDAESWKMVVKEGGVGIDVASMSNGFAAITYNSKSKTRRIRISNDAGKTWQPIDAGLPPHNLISNIIELGEYYFCGHPNGIYRSSDKGKNWELIYRSIDDRVFNLSVHKNVIYAIPRLNGC